MLPTQSSAIAISSFQTADVFIFTRDIRVTRWLTRFIVEGRRTRIANPLRFLWRCLYASHIPERVKFSYPIDTRWNRRPKDGGNRIGVTGLTSRRVTKPR